MATPKVQIETKDVAHESEIDVEMPLQGEVDRKDLQRELEVPRHLAPGSVGGADYMRDLKFMEEPVEFMIAPAFDPSEEPVISCGVNGQNKILERNKPYTLPRKFVNVLIVLQDRIDTVVEEDPKTRVQVTKTVVTRSLKYPIQLLQDTKLGHDWFKWKCQQPR